MIIRLTSVITFGGFFVALGRCQAAIPGEADSSKFVPLTPQEKEIVQKNIVKILGLHPTTASPAPDVQPSSNNSTEVGSCICVPFYLCKNGSLNTNGEEVVDIRIADSHCGSYLEVCCNKDSVNVDDINRAPIPANKTGCGFHHPDGVGFRIIGDNENQSQFGEFPWMVAVFREETVEGIAQKLDVYHCGGALIHLQVVITAAHCVYGTNYKFKIRAGEWDTQSNKEIYSHQDMEVQNIEVHPKYYPGAFNNDVALLHLQSPLEAAKHIGTICLPPQGLVINSGLCYATGWGTDRFGEEGKYQVILKKIELPVVPRAECQEKLLQQHSKTLGRYFKLHKSFMCAGGELGKDTCKGDGGSPLVCPIPGKGDRYYQVGIASWGIGCGKANTPGVYANLPLFKEWIDSQMTSFGLDSTSYEY